MSGAPTWDQIIWLVGLLTMVAVGAFLLAWRIAEIRKQDRHDVAKAFEQRIVSLDSALELQLKALEKRVDVVEDFKTSTMVVLEHMRSFHADVTRRFDLLHSKRESDMQGIHQRLDAIFNRGQMNGET
jgi:hypothetical protein